MIFAKRAGHTRTDPFEVCEHPFIILKALDAIAESTHDACEGSVLKHASEADHEFRMVVDPILLLESTSG